VSHGWRRDRLPEIVRSMASRPRHEALRGLVTELLREGFGAAFIELEHERYLVDKVAASTWRGAPPSSS